MTGAGRRIIRIPVDNQPQVGVAGILQAHRLQPAYIDFPPGDKFPCSHESLARIEVRQLQDPGFSGFRDGTAARGKQYSGQGQASCQLKAHGAAVPDDCCCSSFIFYSTMAVHLNDGSGVGFIRQRLQFEDGGPITTGGQSACSVE